MKRKVIKAVFGLLPLFAGFFVITAKPAPIDLEQYLGRYIAFVALFILWALFRSTFASLLPSKTDTSWQSLTRVLLIVLQAALLVGAGVLFYRRFDDILYQLALLLIGCGALMTRFEASAHLRAFWTAGLCYYAGLSFLSFQMVVLGWEWQTMVFSFAIGAATLSVMTASWPEQERPSPSTLAPVTLGIATACIGLLVFTYALPHWYLLTFCVLPLAQSAGRSFNRMALLAAFFIVILGVLAILM